MRKKTKAIEVEKQIVDWLDPKTGFHYYMAYEAALPLGEIAHIRSGGTGYFLDYKDWQGCWCREVVGPKTYARVNSEDQDLYNAIGDNKLVFRFDEPLKAEKVGDTWIPFVVYLREAKTARDDGLFMRIGPLLCRPVTEFSTRFIERTTGEHR